jgi:RNA polymerase sigma-70 factor (ECF subfamily)
MFRYQTVNNSAKMGSSASKKMSNPLLPALIGSKYGQEFVVGAPVKKGISEWLYFAIKLKSGIGSGCKQASSVLLANSKPDSEEMARLARKIAEYRDKQAFAVLFDYFAPRINAYLQKLRMEKAEAEEITQEVMFTLWHKAALFDPAKSNLSTWLYRIARNRRIDSARRDRCAELDASDPGLLPTPEPMPDTGIDKFQREVILKSALAELPPEQFETLRMAFFLGYSHSQIAEETGLPVGTVKSRIRLAFSRLRSILENEPAIDSGKF